MTAITGNTFPVKDAIKALGGKWNPDAKAWMVPDEKVTTARELVAKGAGSQPVAKQAYHPHKCAVCGVVSRPGYRGRPEPKILRSGECVDCYEERKMGY